MLITYLEMSVKFVLDKLCGHLLLFISPVRGALNLYIFSFSLVSSFVLWSRSVFPANDLRIFICTL